ncbi:hypothetical protein [Algoriphagus namhaensis]
MYLEFNQMPETSRVWVYQANRKLTPVEIKRIHSTLQDFCENWNTHGTLMPTSFEIFHDQIIVLSVDESKLGASGCSIDSSLRTLAELESALDINLRDQGKVSVKATEEQIKVLPALGIKTALQKENIATDHLVINPLIQSKKDLDNLWIPISDSWLNKYFPN